jgi:hypothetical protein
MSEGSEGSSHEEHDGKWRALTIGGNQAFHAQDFAAARELYERSIKEAERIWRVACCGDESAAAIAPTLLIIAEHNLASLDRAVSQSEASDRRLERVWQRMVNAAHNVEVPAALRGMARGAIKYAMAEWIEHASRPPRDGQRQLWTLDAADEAAGARVRSERNTSS